MRLSIADMDQRKLPFSAPPAGNTQDRGPAVAVRRTAASGAQAIEARLAQLDREWDTDRVCVEAQGVSAAVTGLVLGVTNVRWFPRGFAKALLASQRGWAPPIGLIRALGVRSSAEIAEERDALVRARDVLMRTRDSRLASEARVRMAPRPVWTPLAFDAAE